jgi:hypothetical protein
LTEIKVTSWHHSIFLYANPGKSLL